MKKKIAGIILASVLTFSAMAGVQASAEDRLVIFVFYYCS